MYLYGCHGGRGGRGGQRHLQKYISRIRKAKPSIATLPNWMQDHPRAAAAAAASSSPPHKAAFPSFTAAAKTWHCYHVWLSAVRRTTNTMLPVPASGVAATSNPRQDQINERTHPPAPASLPSLSPLTAIPKAMCLKSLRGRGGGESSKGFLGEKRGEERRGVRPSRELSYI